MLNRLQYGVNIKDPICFKNCKKTILQKLKN